MSERDDQRPGPESPPPAENRPEGAGSAETGPANGAPEEGAAKEGALKEGAPEQTGSGKDTPEADAEAKVAAEAKAKAAAEAKAKAEAAAAARAAAEAAKPPWERDAETPEWAEADADPLVEALRAKHGGALRAARTYAGDLVLELDPGALVELCADLKENHGYRLLVDVFGVHRADREEGLFEVHHLLYDFESNRRLRLKVAVAEGAEVPSVTPVWRGANWPEREVYDMYGVRFADHPDMTRILLWEGFNGHPLRKEFPVEGLDTGAAIYPEYYGEEAGPVAGTGTGWKPAAPPAAEGNGGGGTGDGEEDAG